MQLVLEFEVLGQCVPWSMPDLVLAKGGKRKFVRKHPRLIAWQERVAEVARVAMRGEPIMLGPVMLVIEFYRETPPGKADGQWWDVRVEAEGKGFVKRGMPQPDLVNLFKGTEDALADIVIGNDAQTCAFLAKRLYGPQDGVRVKVYALCKCVSGIDLTPFRRSPLGSPEAEPAGPPRHAWV
jgi:Holliday junction resolvase RusA-like endonuclease